jgi:hypothetical protein
MHKPFILKALGLTLVLAGIIYILSMGNLFDGYRSFIWTSLAFLSVTTLAVYFIMLTALGMKEHKNFVTAFAAAFGLKSLASLVYLCYFIFYAPIADHHFVFPFFAMYFAYTGLLVWHLFQISRIRPLP